jgi:hypothetical protein
MAERKNGRRIAADMAELVRGYFVELFYDLAQAKGLKKGDFVQKAWPEATPKANRARWLHIWLHIRALAQKTGQPLAKNAPIGCI